MAPWRSGLDCGGVSPPLLFFGLDSGVRQCFALPHWFGSFAVFFAMRKDTGAITKTGETEKQKRQSKALPHSRPERSTNTTPRPHFFLSPLAIPPPSGITLFDYGIT
jgi:hypothetical protein